MEIQLLLFNHVRAQLEARSNMVEIISDLLHVNRDGAYRRMRGEVLLNIKEIRILSQYFNISIDALFKKRQQALFNYINLDMKEHNHYHLYMERLAGTMKKLAMEEEKELLFVADDIPIFHFMDCPLLVYFKLYAWGQSVNKVKVCFEEFMHTLDRPALNKIFEQIAVAYRGIPSMEIWAEETIDPLLKLLQYYWEMRSFRQESTLLKLFDQVLFMLDQLERCTSIGFKNDEKSTFDLYLCPLNPGISQMYTASGERRSVMIKLYTINSISTEEPSYVEETYKWMKSTMDKSTYLSGASELKRTQFFLAMRDKVSAKLASVKGSASSFGS